MPKINLLLVLLGLSTAAFLVFFYSNPEEVGTTQPDKTFFGGNGSAQFESPERVSEKQITRYPVTNPMESTAWTALSQLPTKEEMPHIRSDIVVKTLVKVERAVIDSWRVEDVVRLSIPQNKQEITVQIDVIKVLPSGNQSISGHALDNHDHGFIMTVGKQSIFATIGTEDGVFNIRGNEDYAWVISSRELNHHLHPEILDYRVPKSE
ncbi:hypothetical protein OAS97_10460 [Pseudomonadales bacterium]|nr:hypothetical protein [Pseudomonadales bacterium]